MTDKEKKMAKESVSLRVQLKNHLVGDGNCPYAAYPLINKEMKDVNCNDVSCTMCHKRWYAEQLNETTQEVFREFKLREGDKMTVKELKEALNHYEDNAEVVVTDWSNGDTYNVTVGSDDEDEGTKYCRIGIG